MRVVLQDKNRVVELMQQFEREVVERTVRYGETIGQARDKVLKTWESHNGFTKAVNYRGRGLNSFREMLANGALFNDVSFDG